MAEPTAYDVTIYVNDVDVTAFVDYRSMSFEDHARQVSTFDFTMENPTGITPTRGMVVYFTANSLADEPIQFVGYIMELVSKKRDNGISKIYECRCGDRKLLLQRSVIGANTFTGSDLDILGDLLSNTYPDLSSLFDFSTDATTFADGLAFGVEDGTSLLDALNDFADQTGADYRFEDTGTGGGITVNFDGGYSTYTVTSVDLTTSETASGNPGNAFGGTGDDAGLPKAEIRINITGLADINPTGLTFDWYTFNDSDPSTDMTYLVHYYDGGVQQAVFERTNHTTSGAWESANLFTDSLFGYSDDPSAGYTVDEIRITIRGQASPRTGLDFRLDNILIQYDGAGGNIPDTTNLVWDDTPELADFDIDIQTGDEFAANIDLFEGDFGDFNSVTVIGGYEDVTIDKALDNDGGRDHIAIPYPVTGLAVYTNGGTDTTPSWGSALALGSWGSDTLTGDGGTKDVLYDAENKVLFFDTAPPNLVNSYRITGTIKRPIRVRVENVANGDVTLATSYTDETITSLDEAIAIGQAQLNQRNSIKRLDFTTYEPGLKAGQSIPVADSARGLNETLIIQTIRCKWLGPRLAQFDVECGESEAVGLDTIVANVDRRQRQLTSNVSPDTQTASLYTDDSGNVMIDDSSQYLYEVV